MGSSVFPILLSGNSFLALESEKYLTHLLAQLEDGQSDGDNEREEGELKRVPGLQTEDTDGQGDQGHSLQQHEHQDRDDDLLKLGFTGFADGAGTFLVELDVKAQFVIVEVPWAHGHFGVSDWQLEGDVMRLDVVLYAVEEVVSRAASDVVASAVLRYLNRF